MGVSIVVLTIQISVLVIVACLTALPSGRGGNRSPVGRDNGHRQKPRRHVHPVGSPGESLRTSAIRREFRLLAPSRSVQTFAVRRQDRHDPGERVVNDDDNNDDKTDAVRFAQHELDSSPRRERPRNGGGQTNAVRFAQHELDSSPGRKRPRNGGGHQDDFGGELRGDVFDTDAAGPNEPVPRYDCNWQDYTRAKLRNLGALPAVDARAQRPAEERPVEGAAPGIPCGDGLCRCYKVTADCSSQPGRLTYIPSLPPYVTFLNASNNDLGAIAADTFFANVTNITGLDLSRNRLASLTPGAFKGLSRLRTLYIGYNPALDYSTLSPVFSTGSLTWLDINDNRLGPVPADLFLRFPLPRLINLNLNRNLVVGEMDMTALSHLKSLQFLELGGNDITGLANVSLLPAIRGIYLERNSVAYFPETCFNGTSLFPRLENLILDSNFISSVPNQVCLPNLRYLSLRRNFVGGVGSGAFDQERFPKLTKLCFDWMSIFEIDANAFSNPSLRLLSLRNAGIGSQLFFDPAMFDGCTNLEILSLGMNNLANVSLQRLVGHLRSLRFLLLDADSLGFGELDCRAFDELKNLSHLRLARNFMLSLPDACFDQLPALTWIDLHDNEMRTLNETAFGPPIRKRLTFLDLSGNPFVCDEGLTWLCRWMISEPALFAHSSNTYDCSNLSNATVMDYCLKTPWIWIG